jgi:D-inositol-3-phosphate glycosyltransferase
MNVYVRQLSSGLARSGIECDVYTRAWDPALAAVVPIEPGLRVHHVGAGPPTEIEKERLPAIVPEFARAVSSRMKEGGRPDAIHANYWLSGLAGHSLKHELDVPLVSTFHTLARVKGEGDDDPARRGRAELEVMSCSDAVIASSSVEADQITSRYGIDRSRIEVVAPGVDHAFFSPGHRPRARRALGLPGGPMLLFVGRIQPLKGVDVAVNTLAALHRFPDAFLVVVGGPSGAQGDAELARVRDLVRERRLAGRVRFVEPQPHEMLSTYYRAADVCLVPSRSESFGLVALEAAACGTPVVAADVGGLQTLVDDARTGFLVEGRDPAAFAVCVERLLVSAPLAARMSELAAARARHYSWSTTAGRLLRLCTQLTERAPVSC